MRKELITLTKRELERLEILRRVMKGELRQKEAGALMKLTDRQVRNLAGKVREKGAAGLAHGNRGKPSPKRLPTALVAKIVALIRERYRDFKPKFAAEKLWRKNRIKVSDEKVRQIMIEAGLWRVHRQRGEVHAWRERKSYYGEMVQTDGSHHAWLEDRGPKLVLMGMIDDARNRFYGRFYDYEGVYPAMNALEGYVRLYGIPRSLYVDKHSTYKTVREPSQDEMLNGDEAETQFERAGRELEIEIIHAHSPQAKGRIERVFATLQDRLVKEMRLAGISSLEEANRFLETYLPKFNAQFEREAPRPGDLHRPLPKRLRLDEIFCLKGIRTILNGYIVRWMGKRYAIEGPRRRMLGKPVSILEHFDGRLVMRFEGQDLAFREIKDRETPQASATHRPRLPRYVPPRTHPWKVYRGENSTPTP